VGSGQQHPYVNCLGALTGGQAVQQAKAGIKAIYLSGWQVAADNNEYAAMYPDQSLYPVDSVPKVVERINNAFNRADEIQWSKNINPGDAGHVEYHLPIVADAEAGFGGVLNAYELMKAMIRAGAAGVHWEDQLASVKKCGHMGGKVLVPTTEAVQKLIAARMAADVYGVPTLVIARTDAEAADLLTSDYDENDKPFLTGERTAEGFYKTKKGLDQAISRAIAYADYADLVWCETGTPDLEFARKFAEAVHKHRARCWPTTARRPSTGRRTWTMPPSPSSSGAGRHGLQVPVHHPGWHPQHVVQHVRPGPGLRRRGMSAYVEKVQEPEFAARDRGYTFVSHQQEVGTGYFDDVTTVIQGASPASPR
jgi:isocitrate lyase